MKPFSEACERNKGPILEVLRPLLGSRKAVLEIGSGTGQHAVHFAAGLPHLLWQTSDRPDYLEGIRLWIEEAGLANLPEPLSLDVNQKTWPKPVYDAVFTANSLQIMSQADVKAFFKGVQAMLPAGGLLAVYGPFTRQGGFTSEGDKALDAWIRSKDPLGGIKDLEAVTELAQSRGFRLQDNLELPSNNRLLYWLKAKP